ncbi:phosphatidylglycerol lysyltransferase domain-containing protein [Variovorax sp. J22G21]|uniref:phosphatidylglycerol lysyltransferase domain-containing protein n=1 Tax=Variovorax fucosicus TaxID=3053517 RepID=UPI002576073B|nr:MULTISPECIES: phosphatidylglycerol lysyltransferase domain-containing protein [unclassified Variovorax]MDM0041292.1 phosphatidylglycerol lysyltransferase domain-containing protein [Variovorax sp. J22R193]MDM0060349.1 phosphatidylglycerol lysyltransferase domain-containing protein [Variovorax sp. J22G21]
MTGEPITLALQPRIEAALDALRHGTGAQCLSDHAFSNLYLFREAHGYRFLPGDWPGVAGHTYDGTRHFLPLFDVAAAPPAVLAGLIEAHGCLYPVASAQAEALPADRFAAASSPDDADYLYDAATLRDYPGRALAKKRNLVRQFLAQHAPYAVPFDAAQAEAARAVLRGWMLHKGKAEGEADERACLEAIGHAQRFGFEGFVHCVGALPVAFLLVQALQPGVFAVRFAKGLDSHVGVYPYMFQHFCRAFEQPVHWLNFEQDMGLAGFRRSKRSYRPSALLPKWRVALRD